MTLFPCQFYLEQNHTLEPFFLCKKYTKTTQLNLHEKKYLLCSIILNKQVIIHKNTIRNFS